jgi:chromosome segregation ATPase
LQDSTRKHQERETLLERLQQRETMLFQENEALRSSLATAKLDVVEASNANARNEAELNELSKTVETRNAEIERHSRENEALREKNTALSIENDKIAKREAEARHRLEENAQIHEKEAARNSELLNALAASEKETLRLQKALDRAIATQAELKERAAVIETEREADMQRAQVESRGLRSEIQNLQTRLEAVLQEQSAAIAEKANVKERLKDALAEKYVLEERLSALVKESEADRVNLSRLSANLSELTLRQASEQIQLDVRIQECEDLRGEIAALNAQIKELLPYERLHRVTQARQREAAGSVVDFDTAAADTKRGNRRPHGHGRRHV